MNMSDIAAERFLYQLRQRDPITYSVILETLQSRGLAGLGETATSPKPSIWSAIGTALQEGVDWAKDRYINKKAAEDAQKTAKLQAEQQLMVAQQELQAELIRAQQASDLQRARELAAQQVELNKAMADVKKSQSTFMMLGAGVVGLFLLFNLFGRK